MDQLRRCVVSIASNIAEGAASDTDAQFRRFLGYAMGSAAELQSQLEICVELSFLDGGEQQALDAQLEELKRMISGLRSRLR